ncbi:MAG: TolC family protein [Deltaproteobacteria bacterium]|nr:TolC family protein [Deltaproteobacteria bacterium]
MKSLQKSLAALMMVFAFFVLTSLAWSAEPGELEQLEKKLTEGASLSDLVTYAYRVNPSVKAAREAWKGMIERYRVETGFPDPEIGFSYFPEPLMSTHEVMISQMIPFPGKLFQAGEVVKAEIEMARLEYDKTVRDTIVGVRESYHELFYIKNAKRVVALNRDLLEHLRKVGETAYAQDRATFFDVVKAQSQLAQLQYDAVLLEELEQTEKAQLNARLSRPPGAEIKFLDEETLPPLVYKLEEVYNVARKYQEEIRMAEAQINKARAKVGLAKYEYLPMFRLGASYLRGNPDMVPEEFRDAVGVQFGLSIPIWINKIVGRVEEARAEERKALSMKTSQINETNAMIGNVYFRLKNSERLIRLYRDQLLPQASQAMEIAETWFREKQGSFTDFVETQSVFYNFQLALARAKADYGRYLAQLERLAGRSVTHGGGNEGGKRSEKGAR